MWACMGRPRRSADKCHYGSGVKRVTLAQHVCWHLIGSVYCLCQAGWTVGLALLTLFPFAVAIISLFYKRSGMYGWGSEVIPPVELSMLSATIRRYNRKSWIGTLTCGLWRSFEMKTPLTWNSWMVGCLDVIGVPFLTLPWVIVTELRSNRGGGRLSETGAGVRLGTWQQQTGL